MSDYNIQKESTLVVEALSWCLEKEIILYTPKNKQKRKKVKLGALRYCKVGEIGTVGRLLQECLSDGIFTASHLDIHKCASIV